MSYLLAGQLSEIERLRLQSRVWEPAGERLLTSLGAGSGQRVLEVGCGVMGWLGCLSRWVGERGVVIGTDIANHLLDAARLFCAESRLPNVTLLQDDFFATQLEGASFDLVHLRFQLCSIGRVPEQMAIASRLLKPGGRLILEDPDAGSWHENPVSAAAQRLRELIVEAFIRGGGDFSSGRRLPEYLRSVGIEPQMRVECLALEAGHPYLHLPVQFATSLKPRLLQLVDETELSRLTEQAASDLASPHRWGTTFTLVQAWGQK